MLQLQPATVLKMDRHLLARATSSDDKPTPGYMYGEIAKMSLISHEACKELEDYLLSRLKKGNAPTKHKCLQIMKHVCRAGRADFKRDLQRQAEAVRDCLQYRGPPDPLKGEVPYQLVREAAKEALEAIYETTPPGGGVGPSPVAHRIQGFGSEPHPSTQPYQGVGQGAGAPYHMSHDGTGIGSGVGGGLSSSLSGSGGGLSSSITDMASSVVSAVTAKLATAAAAAASAGSNAHATMGGGGSYTGPGGGYAGPGGARGGGGTMMQGMGNPAFGDPRRRGEKGLLEKAGEMIGTVVNSVNSAAGMGVVVGTSGSAPLQRVTFAAPPDRHGGFASAHPGNTSSSAAWSRESPTPGHTPYQSGGAISPLPPTMDASSSDSPNGGGGYQGGGVTTTAAAAAPAASDPLAPAATTRRPGGVGGVWGTAAAVPAPSSAGVGAGAPAPAPLPAVAQSQQQPQGQQQQQQGQAVATVGRVGGAATDGSYERRLVLELCPPGGTRAVPPADKLAAFVRAAGTLNVEVVGGVVLDLLGEESWQVRAKALCVAEALVKHAAASSSGSGPRLPIEYHEFFVDNIGELQALVAAEGGESKAAVRDRAVRVLQLLGSAASASEQHQPATRATTTRRGPSPLAARQASLLEFDDEVEEEAAVTAAVPVPAPSSSGGAQALGGLFSDMTLKTPTSTTPPKQHPSNGGHGDSNGNGNSGGRSGRVDLIAGLAASPVTVSGNPLLQFDPLTISAASSSSAASAAAAASATAAIAIPTPAPAPAPPTGARTDLLCDLLSASPPSISTSGGGLPLAPLPGMHAPVAHPQPQPPMPPVDLARMGQGMIPALQPRTIIPSVGDADGAGASAFSFIGGAGAGGGGAAPQRSMPGSMMMMMQGGVAPQGGGRGNGGGGKGGEDEAAFSFVKDAMKQSR